MQYEIVTDPTTETARLKLISPPENIFALALRSWDDLRSLERPCLLVFFPVWSGPDRQSVQAAITAATEGNAKFSLGLCPFTAYEELHFLSPDQSSEYVTPVWVGVHTDIEILHRGPIFSADEVVALARGGGLLRTD